MAREKRTLASFDTPDGTVLIDPTEIAAIHPIQFNLIWRGGVFIPVRTLVLRSGATILVSQTPDLLERLCA